MKIILQAGGKGTRLEHLTENKPKCLVPVKNKPLIFHLFDKYPDGEFIIIGDYKFDVLEKYLKTFAKNVNYELISSRGGGRKGNICGIKQALERVNDNEKFLLIWCDIILSDSFKPEELPNGNYIGILEGSLCSWSFIDGKLEKIPSDKYGVAGCFLFENKKPFVNIPMEGSFTSWLKLSGIKLKPLIMKDCREAGTLDSVKSFKDTENRSRPYNKIEIKENSVIKTGLTPDAEKLIEREINWYKKMQEYGFSNIPKIYEYSPLTMEKIAGTNIFQSNLNEEEKLLVTQNLINAVNKLHNYETQPANEEDLFNEYYTKTIDRLNGIKNTVYFAEKDYININGKMCKNPLYYTKSYKDAVKEKLLNTVFCPIHGDCTLTNTLVDSEKNIYFIDPRGYFGKQYILGDIRYDWAKLYYSMCGNFDRFNVKDFKLKIEPDGVRYEIESNGWEDLTLKVLENMNNCNVRDIKFIHAIIWLSLASHCSEDYDSMCLAFYNGTYLIQEHI